ncbi:uncharacterized protein LOC132907471 [Bombus pascuorum]|uniref:uncharacterized protein LOC132907471 n=1 Tax=Bombus pascuorum TaxID=65598 RepID=UPI00298E69EC|nr:uncharacterized protein LOC132907471 [Bombus pascuorum]
MNNIRVITFKLLRRYATKPKPEIAGVRGKIRLMKIDNNREFKDNLEEFDQNDVGLYETDFADVIESYADHERQTEKDRELLKHRIIKRKYFKEVEPNFLTYVEKDQIQKLHDENPDEWTPERLSESFPALPETIKRILKSKWEPKSVERILAYDNKVIKNWKQFKTGQLPVNSNLKEHLMKFKDRKICLTDRKILVEKYIPAKIEFPKPSSSFFRSIVADSIEEKPIAEDKVLISSQNPSNNDEKITNAMKEKDTRLVKKTSNNLIHREMHNEKAIMKNELVISSHNNTNRNRKKSIVNEEDLRLVTKTSNGSESSKIHGAKIHDIKQETLLFEEFLKHKLHNSDETSYEERATLLNTYKKYIESKNSEDVSRNILNNTTKGTNIEEKCVSTPKSVSGENMLDVRTNATESKVATKVEIKSASLDTYVKERISYMDMDFEYTKRIKIPQSVYKKDKTYRIKDCYYDYDGEFLYRIPGLRGD